MAGVVRTRARAGLLAAAVCALPLLLGTVGGPAAADGRPISGIDRAVPLDRLVPGLPLPAGTADTPDQGMAPRVGPGAARPGPVPTAAQARDAALTEFVPADDAATLRAVRARAELRPARGFCSRHTGPYQEQVERFLHLAVPAGRPVPQTPVSCAAIRRYQRSRGIRPAIGFAGPVTWGTMGDERLAAERASKTAAGPDAAGRCPASPRPIACVDQNRQLMWVRTGHRVVFGPVRVRTGKPGARTRDGLHRVYWRDLHHVSTLYGTPMPYAQFFDGGEAFHGVYGSLYAPTGSYGCVNLRPADARRLWHVLRTGDPVYVWGRKP